METEEVRFMRHRKYVQILNNEGERKAYHHIHESHLIFKHKTFYFGLFYCVKVSFEHNFVHINLYKTKGHIILVCLLFVIFSFNAFVIYTNIWIWEPCTALVFRIWSLHFWEFIIGSQLFMLCYGLDFWRKEDMLFMSVLEDIYIRCKIPKPM